MRAGFRLHCDLQGIVKVEGALSCDLQSLVKVEFGLALLFVVKVVGTSGMHR